jgi:Endonuclease NucS
MSRVPTERQVRVWREAIFERGSAMVKLRVLLSAFGQKRRGSQTITRIQSWLSENGLFPTNIEDAGLDNTVHLRSEKDYRIGELVAYEIQLQKLFLKKIMHGLGLRDPKEHYKPRGTRDKFDFLCRDRRGRSVVVELKRNTGEKRAVEQVLKYIGHLRIEGGHKDPRGILITGSKDRDTLRALQGRDKDAHIDWYLYGFVEGKLTLKLCRVPRVSN